LTRHVAALLGVSVAAVAHAERPRPTVLVLVEGAADRPSGPAFAEALLAAGDAQPILAEDVGVRLASDGRIPEGAEALGRAAFDRGREHLRLLAFAEAESAFSDAVRTLRAVGTPDAYWICEQAEIGLGVTQLESYRRDAALRTFASVLSRTPDFVLDPVRYSPFVREAFEQARANVATLPRGGVRIATRPEGVEVFLDGHSLGPSPVEKGELVSGEHVVAISGAQGTWSGILQVPASSTGHVTIAFGAEPGGDRALQIAKTTGVDRYVVLTRAGGGRVRGHLEYVNGPGGVTREAADEAALARIMSPALAIRAAVGIAPPPPPPHRVTPWYENWWVYAIGVGVVGGGVATLIALSGNERSPAIEF